MKKLPEKITLFINWDDNFVTADVCEVLDKLQSDDDLFMFFLEEWHPDLEDVEKEDLPERIFDEFLDFCSEQLEAGWNGWEIKKLIFPIDK